MVFSSATFLFLFLPLVLLLYHLIVLPANLGYGSRWCWRASNLFLLLSGSIFYFWGEQFRIWIIFTTALLDYTAGRVIAGDLWGKAPLPLVPGGPRTRLQKTALAVSITCNLCLLAYFKYFNFGVDSFNSLVDALGLHGWQWTPAAQVALPLGISFYTFQSMSYTIDVYRGHVQRTRSLVDFASYVMLFPQMVAGPIVRYADLAEQMTQRAITRRGFAYGVGRFILGLGKKMLIANTVAVAADKIFALPLDQLNASAAWLGIVCYTLQIYFDFSGYSDMAIGLGHMLGLRLPENFHYPYFAQSVQDFWRRWHISLSTWFRDYLYIPLGGNRHGTLRTHINLITVFFLCGLWHGANWTFLLWGLYHGCFLVFERMKVAQAVTARHAVVQHTYAMLVVMGGWVLFRCDTVHQALGYFAALAGCGAPSGSFCTEWCLTADLRAALLFGVIFSLPIFPALTRWCDRWPQNSSRSAQIAVQWLLSLGRVGGLAVLLLACCMVLAAGTHNPFIYFRF